MGKRKVRSRREYLAEKAKNGLNRFGQKVRQPECTVPGVLKLGLTTDAGTGKLFRREHHLWQRLGSWLGNQAAVYETNCATMDTDEAGNCVLKPKHEQAVAAFREMLIKRFPELTTDGETCRKQPERNVICEKFAPQWLNTMGEAMVKVMESKWTARDAQYPAASRNFLYLAGRRGAVEFHKTYIPFKYTLWEFLPDGSGIAVSMMRDTEKLRDERKKERESAEQRNARIERGEQEEGEFRAALMPDMGNKLVFKFRGRRVKLPNGKYAYRIEPQQRFVLKQLGAVPKKDGHVHAHWKRGDASIGVVYDGKNRGQLRLMISYMRPVSARAASLDKARELHAAFMSVDVKEGIKCALGSAREKYDEVDSQLMRPESLVCLIAELRRHAALRYALTERLKACSSNKHAADDVRRMQANNSLRRKLTLRRWNGTWAKQLTNRATAWKCGVLKVTLPPFVETKDERGKVRKDRCLFGVWSWPWSEFLGMLKSKCDQRGIELRVIEPGAVQAGIDSALGGLAVGDYDDDIDDDNEAPAALAGD